MVSAFSLRALGWAAAPVKVLLRPFPRLNAAMWDVQYRLGLWDYLDVGGDGAQALRLVDQYAPNARILDLGCGTSANLPLVPGRYAHYHGVDISAAAIARAQALGRPGTTFEAADILSYQCAEHYDAILLREVLYYFAPGQVAGLLRRLAGFLSPGGKIIVQVWDAYAGPEFTGVIRDCGLPVVAEQPRNDSSGAGGVFLVLALPGDPAGSGRATQASIPAS